MPTSENFWNRHAAGYAKSPIKDMDAYNTTMERTKAHLDPSHTVLEVGCGTGSTAILLADSVAHITATDISTKMIEIANGKIADHPEANITFLKATLDDDALASKTGGYDAVLAYNFLHLLEDPEQSVARIRTLLKPGGVFISKTICLSERTSLLKVLIAAMRLVGYAPYVNFMKITALDELIKKAGFEIMETGLYPPSGPSRFIVAKKAID